MSEFVYLYPSEFRVLQALYHSTGMTTNQLIEEAKVGFPPDCIKRLRDKWINIYCESIPNPNELSRRQICDYSITPDTKRLALFSILHHQKTNPPKE